MSGRTGVCNSQTTSLERAALSLSSSGDRNADVVNLQHAEADDVVKGIRARQPELIREKHFIPSCPQLGLPRKREVNLSCRATWALRTKPINTFLLQPHTHPHSSTPRLTQFLAMCSAIYTEKLACPLPKNSSWNLD